MNAFLGKRHSRAGSLALLYRHFWIVWVLSSPALAEDVITLRDGRRLRGTITRSDDNAIVIRTPSGRSLTVPRSRIDSMIRKPDAEHYLRRGAGLRGAPAVACYRRALKAFPDHPELRARYRRAALGLAREHIATRHYAAAASLFDEVLRISPDSSDAGTGRAAAAVGLRKLAQEAAALREVVRDHPDNDLARFHLGETFERLGQPDAAEREYRRIIGDKASFPEGPDSLSRRRQFIRRHLVVTDTSEEKIEPVPARPEAKAEWQEDASDHFIVRHQSRPLARRVLAAAEAAYRRNKRDLAPEAPDAARDRKIKIVIFRTRRQLDQARGARGPHGSTSADGTILASEQAPRLTRSVIPHEVTHAVLRRYLGQVPSWIDEGLALRLDPYAVLYRQTLRDRVEKDEHLPLSVLFRSRPGNFQPERRDLFYGQAHSLVDFLLTQEGGVGRLVRFARALRHGTIEEQLERFYPFDTLTALEKAWLRFVRI